MSSLALSSSSAFSSLRVFPAAAAGERAAAAAESATNEHAHESENKDDDDSMSARARPYPYSSLNEEMKNLWQEIRKQPSDASYACKPDMECKRVYSAYENALEGALPIIYLGDSGIRDDIPLICELGALASDPSTLDRKPITVHFLKKQVITNIIPQDKISKVANEYKLNEIQLTEILNSILQQLLLKPDLSPANINTIIANTISDNMKSSTHSSADVDDNADLIKKCIVSLLPSELNEVFKTIRAEIKANITTHLTKGGVIKQDNWKIIDNDMLMLGTVHASRMICLKEVPDAKKLWDDKAKRLTVLGRELVLPLMAGYTPLKGGLIKPIITAYGISDANIKKIGITLVHPSHAHNQIDSTITLTAYRERIKKITASGETKAVADITSIFNKTINDKLRSPSVSLGRASVDSHAKQQNDYLSSNRSASVPVQLDNNRTKYQKFIAKKLEKKHESNGFRPVTPSGDELTNLEGRRLFQHGTNSATGNSPSNLSVATTSASNSSSTSNSSMRTPSPSQFSADTDSPRKFSNHTVFFKESLIAMPAASKPPTATTFDIKSLMNFSSSSFIQNPPRASNDDSTNSPLIPSPAANVNLQPIAKDDAIPENWDDE